jgi:predicted Ser/Thr protein kinase
MGIYPNMNVETADVCPRCGNAALSEFGVCLACVIASAARDAEVPEASGDAAEVRMFRGYEILREVGRGGMGVVFEARQIALNRKVALKVVLAGDLAGEETRRQFAREAEALARNRHPGVVPIYDFGEHDGRCFYAMQFIEGESLARRLRGTGPAFTPREAAVLIARVGRALDAVHRNGIVHLDVSPENVLLDAEGEPWLSDFGLACFMGETLPTRTYVIVGKPDYLSPELACGRRENLSPRSDIFSLGAMLYELLTGRRPFAADSALGTLDRVRSAEPVSFAGVAPRLDPDLETICRKSLEKAPKDRYSSAAEFADDLERWLRGEPILARPVPALEKGWKWIARHPLKAAFVSSLVLLVALPVLIVAYFYAVVVPETARSHPTVGRDFSVNGFIVGLDTGRVSRASMNFDTVSFRLRDRPALLYVTNVPTAASAWVAALRCQVMADTILTRDEARGPVVHPGERFIIAKRQRLDRAYYIAPLGWQGQDLLARAPNARFCITLLDPEERYPERP